jgi:hypothetical protein
MSILLSSKPYNHAELLSSQRGKINGQPVIRRGNVGTTKTGNRSLSFVSNLINGEKCAEHRQHVFLNTPK